MTCGSHLKKEKKNHQANDKTREREVERQREREKKKQNRFLFLSQIYGNLTVGIRRAKNEKCSTRRRLCVGTKKHGISPRIQVKIQKILIFGFSHIYDILTVKIFGPRIKVTLHDESYAWVPKSRDFVGFPREIVNTYKIINTYKYV